jgi:hypothetical protein
MTIEPDLAKNRPALPSAHVRRGASQKAKAGDLEADGDTSQEVSTSPKMHKRL